MRGWQHDLNPSTPQPFNLSTGFTLKYDAWNRLITVVNPYDSSSEPVTVATYAYDGQNWRIRKTSDDTIRDYYYSNRWQVVEESIEGGPNPDRQFVWGIRGVDDLILRDRPGYFERHSSSSSSDPYRVSSSSSRSSTSSASMEVTERLYAVSDISRVNAILIQWGGIRERVIYSAFGVPTFTDIDSNDYPSPVSGYDWETLYAGYRYDTETGLYQLRNRYYHPSLGRFLTRDPIGLKGGVNLYAYVENNTVNRTDPMGLAPFGMAPYGFGPIGSPESPQQTASVASGQVQSARSLMPSDGPTQVISGVGAIAGGIGQATLGIFATESGPGAVVGIPMILSGVATFDLGMALVANGLAGGGPVNTPSGTVPGGPIELAGALTGNPNIQAFGGLLDPIVSLFPEPDLLGAVMGAPGILLNTPVFDPNQWPFGTSGTDDGSAGNNSVGGGHVYSAGSDNIADPNAPDPFAPTNPASGAQCLNSSPNTPGSWNWGW